MTCSICFWADASYKINIDGIKHIFYCDDCIKPIRDLLTPETIETIKEVNNGGLKMTCKVCGEWYRTCRCNGYGEYLCTEGKNCWGWYIQIKFEYEKHY